MTASAVTLGAVGRVRAYAPKTLAGYRRFRSVIEGDGALPKTLKLLFVAAAACVKGYGEMAERDLRAAAAAGLDAELAGAAIAILASSRGEGAALRFESIFARVYPDNARIEADESELVVAPG